MNYQEIKRMDDIVSMQLKFLTYMEGLIQEDERFVSENPEMAKELPPFQNIGVLKSHFLTQKKACEGLLSLTARHLPRLKEEYEKNKPKPEPKAIAKATAKVKPQAQLNKSVEKSPTSTTPQDMFVSLF